MGISPAFGSVYDGRRVLVTGHTGFKGSWLVFWLRELGAEVSGLALAPETDPSHYTLLGQSIPEARVDLRDATATREAVERFQPQIIFHLAAQSLVRRSYRDPLSTVQTNVIGLVHLLEAVRSTHSVQAVVNATTDKCYENDGRSGGYTETDCLGGHDPYSASKACAEILSSSWRRSFFLQPDTRGFDVLLATARAGNVIGGGDWAEDRLVPDLVRAAVGNRAAAIRNPHAVRPWQHVLEPLSGYLELGRRLLQGDRRAASAWNFGPTPALALSVGQVASNLAGQWPSIRIETDKQAHAHEAEILALDWSKAGRELRWRPVWDAPTMLARTANWYRTYYESGRLQTHQDLNAYRADAARAGLAWATG
jgi:CDP-glucose 4,6-dehydratase